MANVSKEQGRLLSQQDKAILSDGFHLAQCADCIGEVNGEGTVYHASVGLCVVPK